MHLLSDSKFSLFGFWTSWRTSWEMWSVNFGVSHQQVDSIVMIRSVNRKEIKRSEKLPFKPDTLKLNPSALRFWGVIMGKMNCLVSLVKQQQEVKVSHVQTLNMCLFSTFLFVNLFTCGFSPQTRFFFFIRQIIYEIVNLSRLFFPLDCKNVEVAEALV